MRSHALLLRQPRQPLQSFCPVVFIQSDFQDILRELALSMVFPLLASLLVALTLVPALASKTLSLASRPPTGTGVLIEMYTVCLKAGLRHRISVSLGIVGAPCRHADHFFFLYATTGYSPGRKPFYRLYQHARRHDY